MSNVFHRMPKAHLPHAVGGDGPYVIAEDGRRYLDASGGAAVSCLGHSDEGVKAAIREQSEKLAFVHSGFFTTDVLEALGTRLTAMAPGDLNRVYLVSGGSEATESALKLARQYAIETGQGQRTKIISRLQSYHGNTLGALGVGGNLQRRKPFEDLLSHNVSHIDPVYAYRHKHDGESDEDYGIRAAELLRAEIERLGPETVLCFIAETVVGATLGAVPPSPGYFKRIREICDEYGVLLILDEVMCGTGRTGTMFSCEQDGVVPDMLTMAKGLGAGYQAIGALLVDEKIYQAVVSGSGFFQHGHTYMGHATAAAASMAVLDAMENRNLLANVQTQGEALQNALKTHFADHPYVGDVRGRGLFIGVELVADKASKRPFEVAAKVNAKMKAEAFQRGMVCYPMGGTADGTSGDHVLLAPPFIIDESHVAEIVSILSDTFDHVFKEVGA